MGGDTQINMDREQIEGNTGARLAFVRKYLSRDADSSTGLDASDFDTSRGCGRKVGVCSGAGGASSTQSKGPRTSKNPGVPASAAFAAFEHGRLYLLSLSPRWEYRDRGDLDMCIVFLGSGAGAGADAGTDTGAGLCW